MNQLQTFKNSMFGELPVLVVDGTEWFGASESATALSFSDPYKAIVNHVDEEDSTIHPVLTAGGKQNKKFINESGLYSLIFGAAKQGNNSSIKDKAKKYKRWVTSEVLPTIRKHGAYITPETMERTLQDPDYIIGVISALKKEQDQRKALEQRVNEDRPKVVFAEALEVSKDSILVAQLAMILKQNGINIGQNRLFRQLREQGYLCKSGDRYNLPTQKSMNLGILETQVRMVGGGEDIKRRETPKVTGKGQSYFINKFKKAGGFN
jgi:anti-repressor protein